MNDELPTSAPKLCITVCPEERVTAGTVVALEAHGLDLDRCDGVGPTYAYRWRVLDEWDGEVRSLDFADRRKARLETSDLRPGCYHVRLTVHEHPPVGGSVTRGVEVAISESVAAFVTLAPLKDVPGKGEPQAVDPREPSEPKTHHAKSQLVVKPAAYGPGHTVPVTLGRTGAVPTKDMLLWSLIRRGTEALSFAKYDEFISGIMCGSLSSIRRKLRNDRVDGGEGWPSTREFRSSLPFPGVDPYNLLKTATEVFMMCECSVFGHAHGLDYEEESERFGQDVGPKNAEAFRHRYLKPVPGNDGEFGDIRTLPYLALIADKLKDVGLKPRIGSQQEASDCYGMLVDKLTNPCLCELIWSYWHEMGLLAQTMNVISLRFQNKRGPARAGGGNGGGGELDALARLDIDPLRPMANLMWGYIQDEQHRLTVLRRAYEYDHQYGLSLIGRAIRNFRPADSRSKFLEAFHHLLSQAGAFYGQDDDTTIMADGFPLLNGIREVHLLLAEGAQNQFGDLTTTARQEMLMQQWLLARPEMREFLGGRIMVPYTEGWMDRVDTVKRIHGWDDTTITHFHELAVYGERLLLSIRYGNWSDINLTAASAANWARYWRSDVQGYLHAYRAVTGIDLVHTKGQPMMVVGDERAVQPSLLVQRRLVGQSRARAAAANASALGAPSGRMG